MEHKINIAATKSEGIVEVNEVMSVGVFKDCGINYVKFDVKDSNGLKHVFNFNVDDEPNVRPGTKIKVKSYYPHFLIFDYDLIKKLSLLTESEIFTVTGFRDYNSDSVHDPGHNPLPY